jgi:hypothetical protein
MLGDALAQSAVWRLPQVRPTQGGQGGVAARPRLALNRLRQETSAKIGIKAKRLKAGWEHAFSLKILTS